MQNQEIDQRGQCAREIQPGTHVSAGRRTQEQRQGELDDDRQDATPTGASVIPRTIMKCWAGSAAMRTHASTLVALCFSALLLNACDRGQLGPTRPKVEVNKVESGTATQSPALNTTVPAADSVVSPANQTPKAGVATGRSNSAMTRAQESSAMPMAGQNNDHSAPLKSEKGASAP
jgi:hypothetical protein